MENGFDKEIETIKETIAALSQQAININSSILQEKSSLELLKNTRTLKETYRETLGFFKRKERKILDEEVLPELNRKIEELNNEINKLGYKANFLSWRKKEAENKVQQLQLEKDKFQKEEEERHRKEAEEAEKRRLAEEKRKKEEALINSASQGDAKAQYDLSIWYYNENNIEQYVHWLKQAAKYGHLAAQRQLGLMYLKGKNSIRKEINKAIEWLNKAAKQGDSNCQFKLGYLYRYGDADLKPDINKGFFWLEKAAHNNNADAQYQLAILYGDNSQDVIQVDFEKAESWLNKAAKQGHEYAIFHLARLHADNIIPNFDYNIAFNLFEQIVTDLKNQSAPLAMIYLGALFCAGKGTDFNREKGAEYIKKGIGLLKGKLDPSFCFRLGKLHYDGMVYGDTNKDDRQKELRQAVKFFKEASAGGITGATKYIDNSLKALKETLEEYVKFTEKWYYFYKELADKGKKKHEESGYMIGGQYYNHYPWPENHVREADNWLKIHGKAFNELKEVVKELKAIKDSNYDW